MVSARTKEKGGSTSWSTTWRTCGSTWWTWRIEPSGDGEPVWLTPHPRDLSKPAWRRERSNIYSSVHEPMILGCAVYRHTLNVFFIHWNPETVRLPATFLERMPRCSTRSRTFLGESAWILNAAENGIAVWADRQHRIRPPAEVWFEWCALLVSSIQYNTIQWKICTQKLTNTLSV